jgi:hypothetical protein
MTTLVLDDEEGDAIPDPVHFIPCSDVTDPSFPTELLVNITS